MKRKITYICIGEELTLYSHFPIGHERRMQHVRFACVQEKTDKRKHVRNYKNVSEASILRLAKIQEKLAG